jgi:hypothetical protein
MTSALEILTRCKAERKAREIAAGFGWRRGESHGPYLEGQSLVIPSGAPDRYHYWNLLLPESQRLTLCQILQELGAKGGVHRSYCGSACGQFAVSAL